MIHVIMIDKIENRWGNAWKKQNALFIAWSRPRFAIKCNKNTRQINRGKKQSCSPQVVSRNRHHQAFIRYWDVVSRRGGWISWISPICLISWCVPSLPTGVPWLYILSLPRIYYTWNTYSIRHWLNASNSNCFLGLIPCSFRDGRHGASPQYMGLIPPNPVRIPFESLGFH